MTDENQFIVPPSFIALFVEPGRQRPSASREQIAARYDYCEDLATMLTDRARDLRAELGVTEADVLERMDRGLQHGDAGVSAAELLDWPFEAGD